jgi:hypothetical protein
MKGHLIPNRAKGTEVEEPKGLITSQVETKSNGDSMPETKRGGARPGAGRQPNKFVREMMASTGKSRASIYREMARGERLYPETLAFAPDRGHHRKVTGKALDIASWFESPDEQIEVLKLAIRLRAAGKQLPHATALRHLKSIIV